MFPLLRQKAQENVAVPSRLAHFERLETLSQALCRSLKAREGYSFMNGQIAIGGYAGILWIGEQIECSCIIRLSMFLYIIEEDWEFFAKQNDHHSVIINDF